MKAAILHSADSVPVYGDFAEPAAGPGTQPGPPRPDQARAWSSSLTS